MISRRSIVAAATLIMLGNVASRLLGLVREQVIASLFGATGATSAFVAASTVPNMVYDLLIGGALTAALIPVFSEYASRDEDDQLWSLASTVMLLGGLALAVAAAALVLLADPLVWLLAPGLSPSDQDQATVLVRVVMPAVVFLGLSGITTAILYSRQLFVYSAFCVAGFNIGIIASAVLLAGVLDTTSLVLGIVFGAMLQLALQIPGLRKLGFKARLNLRHPALRRILILYAPVAVGLLVTQAGVLIDRNLASQTGEESLAVMRFATTLVQLPVGLVAMAISYAVLPTLSRFAGDIVPTPGPEAGGQGPAARGQSLEDGRTDPHAEEASRSFKATLVMGMRLSLLVMIPATIGLVVLRVPLIQLLFEHQAFTAYATERTALAFLCYAPQLPFLPVDYLLVFAFYARKNTITPVVVGVISVGIYLVVALSLMGPLGMQGLVLANTAQNSLHAIILFGLLLRAVGSLRGYGLRTTVAKALTASAVMTVALLALVPYLETTLDMSSVLGQAICVGTAAAAGFAVYAGAAWLLRVEEAVTLRQALWRRVGRFRPSPASGKGG